MVNHGRRHADGNSVKSGCRWTRLCRSVAGLLCATLLVGLPLALRAEPAVAEDEGFAPFRISVAPDGSDTTGSSQQGDASADGQWVVFLSSAPEYGSTDGHAVPVLADVRARTANALPTGDGTVSVHSPAISADGSTIAYVETPRDGVPRLRILNRTSGTSFVLTNGDGQDLQVVSLTPFFSPDGRYLLFADGDSLDVPQPYHQAAVYDRETKRYDVISRNNQGERAQWYAYPAGISSDGRHAYFWSESPNLPDAGTDGSGRRLFQRDTIADTTVELQKPGEPPNFGLSDNGRYSASVNSNGIRLIDYRTNEETLVELPGEVMPSFCQESGTLTFVSNDAQRFYIVTCQEDPYSTGVLWSFDRSTNKAVRVAGPLVGNVAPFGDLEGIVFDAADSAVGDDTNKHDDVYVAEWPRPDQGASFEYVALGDSYSAGEGNGPYIPPSDSERNKCHRSPQAYAPMLSRLHWTHPPPPEFVACSGAITDDLYNQNRGGNFVRDAITGHYQLEPDQTGHLSTSTKLVTLTIGGNDVGFVEALKKCLVAEKAPNSHCQKTGLAKSISNRIDALNGVGQGKTSSGYDIHSWSSIIQRIHAKAPSARILIGGYPIIVNPQAIKGGANGYCRVGRLTQFDTYPVVIYKDQANWMKAKVEAINSGIEQAVIDSGVAEASYIDVATRFEGHALCDREPWLYSLSGTVDRPDLSSFHPTVRGQLAYEAAFAEALG
jgi:GDSL-like Lipase/Acylhydrolase family/WD40-like Beta Propeller Repeat